MHYNRLYKENGCRVPTDYTQQISDYIAGLRYEDLPEPVLEKAKMILLRTVGASLAAVGTPEVQKSRKMALEANAGVAGSTTVWGSGEKLSPVNAALVLGTMADALNWEDTAWTGYPAAALVPCSWLAAEDRHKSGKDLLTAIVAGYEVYQRIAMAVQPTQRRLEWQGWGLASWQIYAAIVPIAKLYGLDARKVNQAIGLGCESSPIPTAYQEVTGSDFAHYEYGYRARDGFMCAGAAEKGIHNQMDVLDDPNCYTGVICSAPDFSSEADDSWLTKDLGTSYFLLGSKARRWPADFCVQEAANQAAFLVKTYNLRPENIAEIIVDPPVPNRMDASDEVFDSATLAQRSIPFAVAAALCAPDKKSSWYSACMQDPQVAALARCVKCGLAPEIEPIEFFRGFQKGEDIRQTVTVVLKSGERYTADCRVGEMTDEESVEQFRQQVTDVLGVERTEALLKTLLSIETVPDIGAISDMLVVK